MLLLMFRLWGKIYKENRIIKEAVISDDSELNRTRKVFHALDVICHDFDLQTPIWLDAAINDFKRFDKARFLPESFIEQVDFDYLEIQVIEED